MDRSLFKHIDEHVYEEIFLRNSYNVSRAEIKDKGVLDLGGEYGMFSLYCAYLNAKQVLGVEPNHNNLTKYRENTEKFDNVKVLCAIVSSKKDLITTIGNEKGCSRVGQGTQLTASVTLETLVSQFDSDLDLVLKMDIEGGEYDVIYNSPVEVLKRFGIITMEAHNDEPHVGNKAEQLKDYIVDLGYKFILNGKYWITGFEEQHNMPPAYSYKFVRI
jgi:FkbM family methyltransferase